MHHKFSLVDDELLLAGSCNYTTAAVLWNYECIEISRCARRVRCFRTEFDRLWRDFTPLAL